jgi:hypothetical protein
MSGRTDTTDDAILGAYLDGELSPDDARRLKDRLAGDPALARRLEEMQSADLAVRKVFEAADELPFREGVLDLLKHKRADSPQVGSGQGNVVRFPPRALRRYWQAPVAIAASVALAAGFLAGDIVRRTLDGDVFLGPSLYADAIPRTSELHDFLESGVSGAPQVLPSGVSGRLLLTFENRDSDWCRQLQLARETGSVQALACRRDGAWEMEAVAYDAPAAPGGDDYLTASSGSLPAVDAAIEEQMGAGEPLDREEEYRLISNGWEKPDK